MNTSKIFFNKAVIFIIIFAWVYHIGAVVMVFSEFPTDADTSATETTATGLNFTSVQSIKQTNPLPELTKWTARDGNDLYYRRYKSETSSDKTLILLHGSGWHSQQFQALASHIAKSGVANVITPDLRGHGVRPAARGDVSYIGQFEDDLADLISELGKTQPNQKIIMGGHSSGGGLAVRFAGGEYGKLASAYVLLAPYLKYNAPTTRVNSGGWARPLTRRIIGLSMLNQMGITGLNNLTAIEFNFPKSVLDGPLGATATSRYSYRLNTSFAPRDDFEADLKALTQPFLLIAGSNDEAFFADKYEPVISANTASGTYSILPNQDHLGIVNDPRALDEIANWMTHLK